MFGFGKTKEISVPERKRYHDVSEVLEDLTKLITGLEEVQIENIEHANNTAAIIEMLEGDLIQYKDEAARADRVKNRLVELLS